jgi:hypothetical protein
VTAGTTGLFAGTSPLTILPRSITPAMAATDNRTIFNAARRFAVLGDSRAHWGFISDSASISGLYRGMMNRARAVLRGRMRHNPLPHDQGGDAYGQSGITTTGLVGGGFHTALVTAHQAGGFADPYAGAVIILSTNDRVNSNLLSYATTIANLTTIRNALADAGIPIFWIDEFPRNDAAFTDAAQRRIHTRVSEWLRSRDGLPGERCISLFAALADNTSSSGSPNSALLTDLLHLNHAGGDVAGRLIAAALDPYLPRGIDPLPSSAADQFNATDNPWGCLNANPFMLGTGGTAGGTGISGSLADGLTSSGGSTGLTVTLSKVTDADGTVWQRVAGTGTPAAAAQVLIQGVSLAALVAPGDVIDAGCEIRVAAGATGLVAVRSGVFDGGAAGGSKNRMDMEPTSFTDPMPAYAADSREFLRVPRFTINTAGSLIPQVRVYCRVVANSWTVDFRRLFVKKNLPWQM